MDFAIDPALFGVAGPSTSSTGRVREVPSLLQQHEEAKTSTRIPLLSDSGSSEDDDDEEEDEEDDEEDDGDEEASESEASSEDGERQSNEEEATTSRLAARDKGKGRARETSTRLQPLHQLPPMPEPLHPSSSGDLLPPLPPGMDPRQSAMYPDTDGETDYAGALSLGSRSQRTVSAYSESPVSTVKLTSDICTCRHNSRMSWGRLLCNLSCTSYNKLITPQQPSHKCYSRYFSIKCAHNRYKSRVPWARMGSQHGRGA